MDENSDRINQRISGQNHQIAGRDYITNVSPSEPEFDDGNPFKIDCPQCGRVTGRLSTSCKNCDFPVREYLNQKELDEKNRLEQEKRNAIKNRGLILTYSGLIGFIGIVWFEITSTYVFLASALVVALGAAIVNATNKK